MDKKDFSINVNRTVLIEETKLHNAKLYEHDEEISPRISISDFEESSLDADSVQYVQILQKQVELLKQ